MIKTFKEQAGMAWRQPVNCVSENLELVLKEMRDTHRVMEREGL